LHEIDESVIALYFMAKRIGEEKRYCGGEEGMKEQGFDEECTL
jgi:hypothetical protein